MAEMDDARCHAIRRLVLGYRTESLSPAEQEQLTTHLAACPACRDYLAMMEAAAALSCQELVELVTEYLEGALPPAERDRFEAHLTLCEGCHEYLEQMRHTIRLTGRLAGDGIPAQAKEALLSAFRTWKLG